MSTTLLAASATPSPACEKLSEAGELTGYTPKDLPPKRDVRASENCCPTVPGPGGSMVPRAKMTSTSAPCPSAAALLMAGVVKTAANSIVRTAANCRALVIGCAHHDSGDMP